MKKGRKRQKICSKRGVFEARESERERDRERDRERERQRETERDRERLREKHIVEITVLC